LNWEKDLLDLIYNNWTLADPAQADIEWVRAYKPETMRKKGWKPIVAVDGYSGTQADFAGVETKLDGAVEVGCHIICWAKSRKDDDINSAKDTRTLMVEEVQRILKEATLPTGWLRSYASRFMGRVDLDVQPIRVEEELVVRVHYFRV